MITFFVVNMIVLVKKYSFLLSSLTTSFSWLINTELFPCHKKSMHLKKIEFRISSISTFWALLLRYAIGTLSHRPDGGSRPVSPSPAPGASTSLDLRSIQSFLVLNKWLLLFILVVSSIDSFLYFLFLFFSIHCITIYTLQCKDLSQNSWSQCLKQKQHRTKNDPPMHQHDLMRPA